jgi:putative transposase
MVLSGRYTVSEVSSLFGVSRPTVYKYRDRYRAGGREGLVDQSRAPHQAERTPDWMVERILEERMRWGWGSKKIRRRLIDEDPTIPWPARSTIDQIFNSHGLAKPRRRRPRPRSLFRHRYAATEAGELSTIDFKGEFRLGNGSYCHPLTMADSVSRFVLTCKGLESIELDPVWRAVERVFREHGIPWAMLSDNGPPFGGHGMGPLSTFSVRLMKLGIQPVFIDPAHPEQNGSHERMHRTLKDETTYPPAADLPGQQRVFNRFLQTYNYERPHESLDFRRPSELYHGSPRPFPPRLIRVEYPSSFEVRLVSANGAIKWSNQAIFLSKTLAGEQVGFSMTDTGLWDVFFGQFFIAKFDERERSFV